MSRPDLDAILARADAVPTCELLVQGKNARTTRAQVLMDDAGDLRFVADVNENWGPYADLFAHARTDIPALVAYARELEAKLATDRGAPYKCPVCEGKGRIGIMGADRCPTCRGDRILWSRS